jgi:chorismate synthase (EC 4.2.3.5)
MPITMRIAFKPASSIAQKQSTVDIKNKTENYTSSKRKT